MALPATERTQHDSLTLSPEEGRDLFEREAQRMLGMSGAEFLRRWNADEYVRLEDVPENWNVYRLSMLIHFGLQES